MRIDSSGRVGIGAGLWPAHPLHITKEIAGYQAYFNNDNGSAQGVKVRIKSNDSGDFNILELVSASTGSDVTAMVVRDDGNVGIAQNTPQYPIHYGESTVIPNGRNLNWDGGEIYPAHQYLAVSQTSNANDNRPSAIGLQLYNESNTVNTFAPAISWSHQSTSTNYSQSSAAIAGRRTSAVSGDTNWHGGELHFYTARESSPIGLRDTASFIIDKYAQAHLGGGESDTRLYLGSAGGLFGANSSNWIRGAGSNLMYNCGGGSSSHIWEVAGTQKLQVTNGYMEQRSNQSDAYTIRSRNTASGDPGLSLTRDNIVGFGITVRGATNDYADFQVNSSGATSFNETGKMRLYANGNISMPADALWSTAIGHQFFPTGGHYMVRNSASSGNETFIISNQTGTGGAIGIMQYRFGGSVRGQYLIASDAAGIYFSGTSDYRFKENVSTITDDHLTKLTSLRPITYTEVGDSEVKTGFIAHEVEEVYPEFVDGEKDALWTQEDLDARGDEIEPEESVGDPKYQTLAYTKKEWNVYIIRALQQLKEENEALKARIEVLEG